MKKLKMGLVGMLALIIASSATCVAQTYFTWTYGSHFIIGTTSSGFLDDPDKFDDGSTFAPTCPSPASKLCTIRVSIVSGSPMPGKQSILDAVKAEYDRLNNLGQIATFANNYTWNVTIGGVTIQIKVLTKSAI